jgi:hypothetical protein
LLDPPPHAVPRTTTADSNNPTASAGNVRCDMVPPSIPRSTRYSTANNPWCLFSCPAPRSLFVRKGRARA